MCPILSYQNTATLMLFYYLWVFYFVDGGGGRRGKWSYVYMSTIVHFTTSNTAYIGRTKNIQSLSNIYFDDRK